MPRTLLRPRSAGSSREIAVGALHVPNGAPNPCRMSLWIAIKAIAALFAWNMFSETIDSKARENHGKLDSGDFTLVSCRLMPEEI